MAKVIVITSGKGGVGKSISAASIAMGLALRGQKTALLDFDIGLRNIDLLLGCERRVVFDIINVIQEEATLDDALIRDRHSDNLYILPASQTRDKDALSKNGLAKLIDQFAESGFSHVVIDSPSGIERGARLALYFADEAVLCVTPDVSSVRDADRMIGILQEDSRRAQRQQSPVAEHLLINRYDAARVEAGDMLSSDKIVEMLAVKLLGIVPESQSVLASANSGRPVILETNTPASEAYQAVVARLLGEAVALDSTHPASGGNGLLEKWLGRRTETS